jgi:hypothetical protein
MVLLLGLSGSKSCFGCGRLLGFSKDGPRPQALPPLLLSALAWHMWHL